MKEKPIINHLTDLDVYKLNMQQLIWSKRRGVPVVLAMNNRTKSVRLADIIPISELQAQLDHCRTLRFTDRELDYLRSFRLSDGRPQYAPEFVDYLREFQLPPYELEVGLDGQYDLRFPGAWEEASPWETIGITIVNQLRNQFVLRAQDMTLQDLYKEGHLRLGRKLEMISQYPGIRIMEFSTRRRCCLDWQEKVICRLMNELKPEQLTGTSNVWIAMEQGLKVQGTQAHELDMVYACLFGDDDDSIRQSHQQMLKDWWDLYGESLSIALTDTFGSDFFFRDMTREQAMLWKGLRQDSGDPFKWGERAIQFYKGFGVNPLTKLGVFSDGLWAERIIELYLHFENRLGTCYGWGTDLGNDLGIDPISLVAKIIRANGRWPVKLSDNLAKAVGRLEDIARAKRIYGHTHNDTEVCRV
ncbi:MAG: nicotinate phosphoribosyltransferase [bacterium]|nr:nicotinate phosphoribosyltransferase [bacterium]